MNYFEHHIGDWDQATAHLTAVEDGIYSRLVRWYMASEGPLPLDVAIIQRRVRARAKDEKAAVLAVLEEFFDKREDGYHQHRCDEEISRFHETAPEREAKKENDRERQRRARERRKALFDTLRVHGLVPRFDATTSELEAMLSRASIDAGHGLVTQDVTRDNTATHTPDTNHQTPKKKTPLPPGGGVIRFEAFWSAWPKSERKQDKVKCARRWKDCNLDAEADRILGDIEVKRHTQKWQEGYIEAPLVYLNGRRWEDGVTPEGGTATSSIFAGAI